MAFASAARLVDYLKKSSELDELISCLEPTLAIPNFRLCFGRFQDHDDSRQFMLINSDSIIYVVSGLY